jgi:glyoxylase-like metal-dependent hydrolase (beta-lactamase superfamily II)
MIDRRQLLTGVVGGLFASLTFPRHSPAQQIGHVTLNDRLALVTTGGTNVLTLSSDEGLVLVDSGTPEFTEALMASVRQFASGNSVKTLFNTHWHLENTAANELLKQAGATIVAHENTRLWMATPTWMPNEDRYRQPRPKGAQPDKTFYVDGSMSAGRERIEYGYLLEAHTSGDIYVFFRDSNVLAIGDVASPVRDPELDYLTGAWIGGRVDAMDRLLKLSDANTKIVPGFGPVITRMRTSSSNTRSLGSNGSSRTASTTGWRPRSMRRPGASRRSGRDQSSACARSAKHASTSSSDNAPAQRFSGSRSVLSASSRPSYSSFSRASERSRADNTLSSNCLSSSVM